MSDCFPLAAMDGTFWISVLARVVHTTCAATLLGGAIYLRFVLAPAINNEGPGSAEATLFAGRRQAWAACVGTAAGLILISGFGYYMLMILGHQSMPGVYHLFVGVKMLLALVVVALASLIAGKTAAAEKIRAGAKSSLNTLLAATLAIFVLGALAKSQPHVPKTLGAGDALETSSSESN